MKVIARLVPIALAMSLGVANAQSPAPPYQPPVPIDGKGFHPRLKIVNQCTRDVWAVFTGGGNPKQVDSQENSGRWFRSYAQQEQFAGTAATANPTKTAVTQVTLIDLPADQDTYFQPGQFIEFVTSKNIQDSTPGPTAKITSVTKDQKWTLTFADPVKVPSDSTTVGGKAQIWIDLRIGALKVKAGVTNTFEIPDKGAPSGRFNFYMNCPKGDADPFSQSGCTIGAGNTDLAAVNTVAEVSFGCAYNADYTQPASQSNCAFNAGSDASLFPRCAGNPTALTCGPLNTYDYYDVSAVDGYTFPLRVDVSAQTSAKICNNNSLSAADASIDGSMLDLYSCPTEDMTTIYSTDPTQQNQIAGTNGISLLTRWNTNNQPDPKGQAKACVAPYQWFSRGTLGIPVNKNPIAANCASGTCTSTSYYAAEGCDTTTLTGKKYFCPQHSGPQQRVGPHIVKIPDGKFSIHNTNYAMQLYALGYKGYTWQFDDGVGLLDCPSTAAIGDPSKYTTYTITVCPTGGSTDPSQPATWMFSPKTKTCAVSSSPGSGYPSLAQCQQDNMLFVCDDLTNFDPYKTPNALWRADSKATLANGVRWPDIKAFRTKYTPTCSDHNYLNVTPDFVKQTVTLPLCTWYYTSQKGVLCPH